MATVTMGTTNAEYVSKKAFYWTIGILVVLVAALLFTMTPNRDRTSSGTTDTGSTVSEPMNTPAPGNGATDTSRSNNDTGTTRY